jgi:hypothetical protein
VTHELRSPLAVVASTASVFDGEIDALTPAEQHSYLASITASTHRLSMICWVWPSPSPGTCPSNWSARTCARSLTAVLRRSTHRWSYRPSSKRRAVKISHTGYAQKDKPTA